jgi:hypothetical protein
MTAANSSYAANSRGICLHVTQHLHNKTRLPALQICYPSNAHLSTASLFRHPSLCHYAIDTAYMNTLFTLPYVILASHECIIHDYYSSWTYNVCLAMYGTCFLVINIFLFISNNCEQIHSSGKNTLVTPTNMIPMADVLMLANLFFLEE